MKTLVVTTSLKHQRRKILITFLPLPSFEETAKVLDMRRLGCQRSECLLLLKTLYGEDTRWQYHKIVSMWAGYEFALAVYGCNICAEWIRRGYKDTTLPKIAAYLPQDSSKIIYPSWDERLYSSHRAALLYKAPEWYVRFGWKESPKIDFYWPTKV